MTISMTGFAAQRGEDLGFSWLWDLRSVNGKGLDLRLRVPDWIEGLEPLLRAELQKNLGRGNVSLGLKLSRDDTGIGKMSINPSVLADVLAACRVIEAEAGKLGLSLRPNAASDILALRGVWDAKAAEEVDTGALRDRLMADFVTLLAAFKASRAAEGAALHQIVAAQIEEISKLCDQALIGASARHAKAQTAMREALARLGQAIESFDETRVAQELALLAVKGDVTEELDRLRSHIAAARGLLNDAAPSGRRFDFLMQEFLREANTLMSKSQDPDLTRIGLDLKTVIDQMREQVQNIE